MTIDDQIHAAIGWLVHYRDKVCQHPGCNESNHSKLESHTIFFRSKGFLGLSDKKYSILLCTHHHKYSFDAPHKNNKAFWVWLEEYLIHRGEKDRLRELNVLRHSPPVQIRLVEKKALFEELIEEIKSIKDIAWMDDYGVDETFLYRDPDTNEPVFGVRP